MTMRKTNPRVAILGFVLESNRFAPLSTKEDFEKSCWEEGDRINELARQASQLPSEIPGFYKQMDTYGTWTPLPLIVIGAPPGGPTTDAVWEEFMHKAQAALQAAMPVDAVYACNHGASTSDHEDDTEGVMMQMIRDIVGPAIPIIATHDLHCNVSEQTVDALDALIAYRTNPHVDQRERGAEAADLLNEIFSGVKTCKAFIRMPITPPSVSLLSARGPYADLLKLAYSLMQKPSEGPIANVSVAGGFVFSDVPKCGMTITVTSRGDLDAARQAALTVARAAWADRARYVADTIEVERAVEIANQADKSLLFADVADNPGGGGRGNTTWLLQAFDQAKIQGTVMGVFVSPELATQAHALGVGAEFDAVFNETEHEHSKRYQARVRVLCLRDGPQTGRRGIFRERKFNLGPSALLELLDSGMKVVVGSLRRQLAEPVMLEMHGIDISQIKRLIVKSRGHYRAGFDEFFTDDRIIDVDSPGLTTPNLKRLSFQGLTRPVWPIDDEVSWPEPNLS